jgi:hypothetical protein
VKAIAAHFSGNSLGDWKPPNGPLPEFRPLLQLCLYQQGKDLNLAGDGSSILDPTYASHRTAVAAAAFVGPAARWRSAPTALSRGIGDADGRRMTAGGMLILRDGMLVAACAVGGAIARARAGVGALHRGIVERPSTSTRPSDAMTGRRPSAGTPMA